MSASENLANLDLKNGWRVIHLLARQPNTTGGYFSNSYLVERDFLVNGKQTVQKGFLKAFDFSRAFEAGVDTIKALQDLTNAFDHERQVLDHIRNKRLSHAVTAIDHGDITVAGYSSAEGRVYYLIFQLAEGDVRVQLDSKTSRDAYWCLLALRDVTLGLWQVHREFIAHQDAKPSNVLVYPGPHFRIADFGRSSMRGKAAPHDDFEVAGDRTYAPPELLYGLVDPDFVKRRISCDLYMLGNLAGFLFSGVNVSTELIRRLAPEHHPNAWSGTYSDILPYVRASFRDVLVDLGPQIDERIRPRVIALVTELCEPDVERRGHPRGVGRHNQFSLERYVSQLTHATLDLKIRMRATSMSA